MSKFTITINTDNAAFEDADGPFEMENILNELSYEMGLLSDLSEFVPVNIRDSYGNTVGSINYES